MLAEGIVGGLGKAGYLAQAGDAGDGGRFGAAEKRNHHGGGAVGDGDVGDKVAAGEDGYVVERSAGEGFDFEIDVEADEAGLEDGGLGFEGNAKVFVLDDGDGLGAGGGEQAGRRLAADGDAGEGGSLGGGEAA